MYNLCIDRGENSFNGEVRLRKLRGELLMWEMAANFNFMLSLFIFTVAILWAYFCGKVSPDPDLFREKSLKIWVEVWWVVLGKNLKCSVTSSHILWLPSTTGVTWLSFFFFLIYFSKHGDLIADCFNSSLVLTVCKLLIHELMRSKGLTM